MHPVVRLTRDRVVRGVAGVALLAGMGLSPMLPAARTVAALPGSVAYAASSSCNLQGPRDNVKHVIYVQFDNVHFTRDNPNVPSDLEQMPHLLNFIEGNGTLLTNHHTPLISHTATDILTSLTGVYGDRMGVPVANSFRYYNPNGTTNTGVSFAYWTDPIYDPATTTPTDTTYNMLTADGKNAPAPWVPYTRAGCDVGAVATANIVLENTATDIPTVFGAGSPQAAEVKSNPDQAFADFVGIGVHCAAGSALCSAANGGRADLLPDEPGGYTGYNGLFGHSSVAPQIANAAAGDSGTTLHDLNGNVISDGKGHIGFPGFDGMSAAVSLAYVADMQERGIPVTYAYISDAHDAHPSGPAYGPGSAGYEAALHSYDQAFDTFFTRLAKDGINQNNTLFVFTADENDHFVGGPPSPANCDGVTIPCTYKQIGELNANMTGLLATQQGITTPFTVHSDSAPTVYLTGNPSRSAAVTRNFERASSQLTATNPMTGNTDVITNFLADPVEMRALHMVTSDPARTPTFTLFANPDYFLFAGAPNCNSPCVTQQPGFAWNHGDVSPDIVNTWLGLVGPGVRPVGIDATTWSDHTDIRPTMLSLLGLQDDYTNDGRVLTEDLYSWAIPKALRAHYATLQQLAQWYKAINAPVGPFGIATLRASTRALVSGSTADDSRYASVEAQLSSLTDQRNAVASQMRAMLQGATFNGQMINEQDARTLIVAAQSLLTQAESLAAY